MKKKTSCVLRPADGDNHGVVFDFFELVSVLESLQHGLPGIETLHTLESENLNFVHEALIQSQL